MVIDRIKPGVKFKMMNQEALIFDTVFNKMHVVNATAAKVFLLIQSGKQTDEIIETFHSEFGVDRDILNNDINEVINKLKDLSILEQEEC